MSVQTVCGLVAKAKKKPEFIRDIHSKIDVKAKQTKAINSTVDRLVEKDEFIDNSE